MSTAVTIIHIVVCFFLMLVVLLQAGKGGGMGAAFGGGSGGGASASGSVFGGSGAGGFLRKLTIVGATVFMITSMTLAYIASSSSADALKRMSAKSRIEQERKEKAHFDALGGDVNPEASGDAAPIDEPIDDGAAIDDGTGSTDSTDTGSTDTGSTDTGSTDTGSTDSAGSFATPASGSATPAGDTPAPATGAPPPSGDSTP